MGESRDATTEPLVALIEIRRNTGPHALGCCCEQDDQHPGAPLLVLVKGKWLGAASCADPEHLGYVIVKALDQAGIDLSPVAAARSEEPS